MAEMRTLIRICTTKRLFCCLLGLVFLSVLSLLCQSMLTSDNETDDGGELDGPLVRVKRLLSSSPTPDSRSGSPQSHTVSIASSSKGTVTTADGLRFGPVRGAGTVKTVSNMKPHRFAGEPANNISARNLNRNDSMDVTVNEALAVSDSRLGSISNTTVYLVIVLIHSNIDQTLRRKTIRQTWLSSRMIGTSNVSLVYWFVIGGQSATNELRGDIQKEQDQYGDLLILWNVKNDYTNLTLRSLQSMKHISKHYQFQYMLKTDDDVFLNTPVILSELQSSMYPRQRVYWGRFSCQNPPMEDGRWKETNWHWCDVYYPYAYGGMYILSQDVVGLIAENAESLQIFSCEDVSLGAWLAPYNLHRINDGRIFVQHSTKCSRGYIAVHIPHRLSYKLMMKYFDNLKRKGVICSTVCKDDILLWKGLPHSCLNETKIIV